MKRKTNMHAVIVLSSLFFVLHFSGCTFNASGLPDPGVVDPTCTDGEKNGEETDTDCGGPQCNSCRNGMACTGNGDCASGLCSEQKRCVPQPSCTDGEKNGEETDIDCGGPQCDPCAEEKHCLDHTDCASGFCSVSGLCAIPTCTDGEKNGGETDVDCGGTECPACQNGKTCATNSDCASLVCSPQFVCLAPACTDGVQNGSESDVDCGGPNCQACSNGARCRDASDCYSFVCTDGVCQAPTCSDLTWNQFETDIDCGGPNCPPCPLEKRCVHDDDCTSRYCDITGTCAAITSCKHLVSLFPDAPSGWYAITPQTVTVQAFCYIVPPAVYTFYYVDNGPATAKVDNTDGCKEVGMMLFTPTTSSHYTIARDLALFWNINPTGPFLGPLGIYNPNDGKSGTFDKWCGLVIKNCCEKKMIGGGGDDTVSRSNCGFTSLAGGQFWASEKTDISEPNGDYKKTCWLLFRYDANGNVLNWNDQDCDYSYSSYMCMAIDDTP